MKRFRSGTFVWFKAASGARIYGVVRHLKRTRYSVRSLTGAGKHTGRNWAIRPGNLHYVPPSKVPAEVSIALAVFTLIGKVPNGDSSSK